MPMPSSGDSGSLENPKWRVKVYVLGREGQWDDRGTGYVSCEHLPEFDSIGFRVMAENQPLKELLYTKIFEEEVFQRQGDTIVTWTNPETREDIALSFQVPSHVYFAIASHEWPGSLTRGVRLSADALSDALSHARSHALSDTLSAPILSTLRVPYSPVNNPSPTILR